MAFESITLLQVLAVFLLAGTVKGILGFGLPIITMALLPFIIAIEPAVALSAVVQPATNIFQLVTSGNVKRAASISAPVLFALVPGIVLGSYFLSAVDGQTLLLFVGFTIAAYSLNELFGKSILIAKENFLPAGLGFGFVAGIAGALTALNGWAFIMYLVGIGTSRQEFRSAIALLFLVSGFLISSSFWLVGMLTLPLVVTGMLALVPAFIGMWAGDVLGRKFSAEGFRRLLLMALVFVGCVLFSRGLGLFG